MSSADRSFSSRRSGIIERVTSLLEAVREAGAPPTYTEIAERVSLPPSTTYRLLSTLVAQAWLSLDDEGRYTMGHRSIQLGRAGVDPGVVRGASSEELLQLSVQTAGVAHLAVLERADVLYLDKVSVTNLYHQVASSVGAKMPACLTASGQVLLGSSPTRSLSRPHADGPCPLAHKDRVSRALVDTRRNEGMRVIPARIHPIGLSNVAAPIMDLYGVVAAISVATPAGDVDRVVQRVQEAAQRISESLVALRLQELTRAGTPTAPPVPSGRASHVRPLPPCSMVRQ